MNVIIEESGEPSLIGKRVTARVLAVSSDGAAMLELPEDLTVNAEEVRNVEAIPRHKGYDFQHLFLGKIAATLALPAMGQPAQPDRRFALAIISRK